MSRKVAKSSILSTRSRVHGGTLPDEIDEKTHALLKKAAEHTFNSEIRLWVSAPKGGHIAPSVWQRFSYLDFDPPPASAGPVVALAMCADYDDNFIDYQLQVGLYAIHADKIAQSKWRSVTIGDNTEIPKTIPNISTIMQNGYRSTPPFQRPPDDPPEAAPNAPEAIMRALNVLIATGHTIDVSGIPGRFTRNKEAWQKKVVDGYWVKGIETLGGKARRVPPIILLPPFPLMPASNHVDLTVTLHAPVSFFIKTKMENNGFEWDHEEIQAFTTDMDMRAAKRNYSKIPYHVTFHIQGSHLQWSVRKDESSAEIVVWSSVDPEHHDNDILEALNLILQEYPDDNQLSLHGRRGDKYARSVLNYINARLSYPGKFIGREVEARRLRARNEERESRGGKKPKQKRLPA